MSTEVDKGCKSRVSERTLDEGGKYGIICDSIYIHHYKFYVITEQLYRLSPSSSNYFLARGDPNLLDFVLEASLN